MGTKNDPGAFDYYTNADPDEPMFVLLGRDKHAPTLVWLWAALRELDGEDAQKVKEARECAVAMMLWAKDRDRAVVGFAQATLAGVLEMTRTINGLLAQMKDHKTLNQPTSIDIVRQFLVASSFEKGD